jgi:hypothetical protein
VKTTWKYKAAFATAYGARLRVSEVSGARCAVKASQRARSLISPKNASRPAAWASASAARKSRRNRRESKRKNWFVYAKPPFAGPEAVLAYLARYTHRVAIANSRLIALDHRGVTFRYKDYRRNGQARHRTMTLSADEFIRRFVLGALQARLSPAGAGATGKGFGCRPGASGIPGKRAGVGKPAKNVPSSDIPPPGTIIWTCGWWHPPSQYPERRRG